jgi:A/G-specific adenine glycosylase
LNLDPQKGDEPISPIKFRKGLFLWHEQNPRQLPWKETRDPYIIWLSEIILQQTRVEQGTPYFIKISEKYPSVHHLARVNDDTFFKDWEGLGYYSRARNMLLTARHISTNLNGIFPNKYKDLLKLQGVGAYTAAAIASFAYDESQAVVDGNVIRVISRIFGILEPSNTQSGKSKIQTIANRYLDHHNPAGYNQAIMDFGSGCCRPKQPLCDECPFQHDCYAFQNGLIDTLPMKVKKLPKQHRFFIYWLSINQDRILVKERTSNDIWKNLYEFPGLEVDEMLFKNPEMIRNIEMSKTRLLYSGRQTLSHQQVWIQVFAAPESIIEMNPTILSIDIKQLKLLAMPKILRSFVNNHLDSVNLCLNQINSTNGE